MNESERYDIMFDEIVELKKELKSIQDYIKNEGFSDIKSMVEKYKQVMIGANEIAIEKDETLDRLTAENARLNTLVENERWISVEERLPDEDGKYLCAAYGKVTGSHVFILYFAKDMSKVDFFEFGSKKRAGFYDYDNEWGHSEWNVTHWKRINGSEPPQTGKDGKNETDRRG